MKISVIISFRPPPWVKARMKKHKGVAQRIVHAWGITNYLEKQNLPYTSAEWKLH